MGFAINQRWVSGLPRGLLRVLGCVGRLPVFFGVSLQLLAATAATTELSVVEPLSQAWPYDVAPYQIDRWETEQGLPENSATAMVQTSDGYLWLGTFNGLVRFDGVRFAVLNPANTPGLPSAAIVNLHLDRSGRLWVSTDRGLATLADGRWRGYGTNEGWEGNYVRTFAERANGDLLLTTFDGKVLEHAGGRLRALPPPPGESGQGYQGYADENGQWWVAQNRFIGRWDSGAWVETVPITESIADTVAAGTARDGGLLLVIRHQLQRWHRGSMTASIRLPPGFGGIWSVTEDPSGNVWICSYVHGLLQIRPDGGGRHWTTTNGLSHDGARFVLEDRERNVWVGTSGGGLQRFKPRRFQVLGVESGLEERNIRSVSFDREGRPWMATYGRGLYRMDAGLAEWVPLTGVPSRFVYGQAVLHERGGRMWFGTMGRGAWQMDAQGLRRVPASELDSETILSLFEDARGRVWLGGDRGLAVHGSGGVQGVLGLSGAPLPGVVGMTESPDGTLWFSNLKGVFQWDGHRLREVHRTPNEPMRDILCFLPNADGSLWMGSRVQGLLHWRAGQLRRFDSAVGFPASSVHGILEDGLGYLWMPSRQGITRVSRASLEAVLGGTAARVTAQLLDSSDGLVSVDCPAGHQPVCARDARGRLWFATLKGVAVMDPAAFRLNDRPPPVHIETLIYRTKGRGAGSAGTIASSATNEAVEPESSASTGALSRERRHRIVGPFHSQRRIPPGGHGIEIHYAAPSFSAPEKVRFQVRLEPDDSDWQTVRDRRQAYYHDLPPGAYVFRVRAANNDGIWNETGASLAFLVQPYPWQTGWFLTLSAALLVGLGALAAWWRHQVRHHRALQASERERQHRDELAHFGRVASLGQMASSIAHELNQPLGAILRNAEAAELMLQSRSPDLDEVRTILADIRSDDHRASDVIQRMRALLKRRAFQSVRLDPAALLRDVARLVEAEARSRQVRITTDLPPSVPAVSGDRVQLQQVVLNLLLNAMDAVGQRPGGDGQVWLKVSSQGDRVMVAVSDNGPGIVEDQFALLFEPFYTTKPDGLGMGLTIARAIVEAHGGTLTAGPRPDGGAVFQFQLPCDPSHHAT